jgi:hypothetical protein
MALVKYKNQIEYSFYIWIRNYPESSHPADKERFLVFAKTVCSFNGKKWKDTEYLKQRILKEKPNFDIDVLETILIIYENLMEFFKVNELPRSWRDEGELIERGFYFERGVKNGSFYEKKLPLP